MQKNIIGFTAVLIAFIGIGVAGNFETHYTMQGTVIENGLVELANGETYEFQDDIIKVGTVLNVYMDNNGTDTNQYDDRIESYKVVE